MSERLRALLTHARGHWLTLSLSLLLTLPSLGHRLVLDDFVLRLQALDDPGIAGLASRPLDLFTFVRGNVAENHALMDEGALLPWWTHPELRISFFRPLTSLTHLIDFALFDDDALGMGVHTLLWWAALLFSIAHCYRRFHGPTVLGGLAIVLYAIDDVHGATLCWISNRNAILATLLAMLALSALHRARTLGWKPGYVVGPVCFALGLCAGETALALGGYLAAYVLIIDQRPWRERALMLLPYALIVIAWRIGYQAYGYGAFGSDAYHDPGREPLAFLEAATMNVPILLAGLLGAGAPPFADLYAWGPPELAGRIALNAAITVGIYAAILWPVWRDDRLARFWSLGALLAVLPSAASVPGERLLLFVSLGAAPVFASALLWWWQAFKDQRAWWRGLALFILATSHLLAAPIGLAVRSGALQTLGSVIDRADASIGHDAAIASDHVVVVNPPFDAMVSYLQVARQTHGRPRPKHFHWLATASSPLTITRTDDRTLRVRLAQGYVHSVTERHYNNAPEQLGVGDTVALTGLRATVVETTPDRRPALVDFRFDRPLEAAGLRLLQWNGRNFERFVPPPTHASLSLPADGFFQTLVRNALTMTP